MLRQIIYLSSGRDRDATDFVETSLERIQTRNAELGLTGVLLFADGTFLQVLEGPPDTVGAVLRQIEQDPRHRHVLCIVDRETNQRQFPDWCMGWTRLAPDHPLAARVRHLGSLADVEARTGEVDDVLGTLMHSYFDLNRA